MKDLTFIDIFEEKTGRTSSFGVYGRKKQDKLTISVIGGTIALCGNRAKIS